MSADDIAGGTGYYHRHNLGLIVHVIRPHPGGDLDMPRAGFLWGGRVRDTDEAGEGRPDVLPAAWAGA